MAEDKQTQQDQVEETQQEEQEETQRVAEADLPAEDEETAVEQPETAEDGSDAETVDEDEVEAPGEGDPTEAPLMATEEGAVAETVEEHGEIEERDEVTDEAPENPEQSLLEKAVEEALADQDAPSAEEAGITPADEKSEMIASLEDPEMLRHTAGEYGFTGEVTGRVLTLEELESGQADEDVQPYYDQLRSLVETTLTKVTEREIVTGRVASVGEKDIVVDIGFKSDGIIAKSEFGDVELELGDTVEVYLERLEDYHGQLVVSKTKADEVRRWQRVEEAYDNEDIVEGEIVRRIKGGMIVELFEGLEAFLPGSQIDVRRVRDFDAYLGKRMEFKIVKLNPENENIVVSHRALIQKELDKQREVILEQMEVGQVLEGVVKNIVDFGVFIDLGGVDGLLHITDLSWGRVSHPSEVVDLDQELNVVVLDYDQERQRISLGLKQLMPHPWDNIEEKFEENDTVEGKVVSITNYGAFVELEKGIEGLVHISEMSWTDHIRHPSQMVSLGQLVEVKILNIDTEGKKISLGMKQLQPDPWEGISDRYPAGTRMTGKVRNITNFGVFVEIEPGIDGLVHISDLSWTKKIRHPSEIVDKGEEMDVVILNIDEERRRISLGHKQISTNPWDQFAKVYATGSDHEAEIVRVIDSGLVVELPLEVEGFVPASELKNTQQHQEFYKEGDSVELRVIRFDMNDKDIILSEQAKERAEEHAERQEARREERQERKREQRDVQEFKQREQRTTGPTTLGELSGLASLKADMEKREAEAAAAAEEADVVPVDADNPETEGADDTGEVAETDEQSVETAEAHGEMEGTPGKGQRAPGKAKQDGGDAGSNTEPADEQSQRQEEAGEVLPAEKSEAAHKGAGETDPEGTAAAAEKATEDETPSTGTGAKPVASVETGQSPEEIEDAEEAKAEADEALSDEDEEETEE